MIIMGEFSGRVIDFGLSGCEIALIGFFEGWEHSLSIK